MSAKILKNPHTISTNLQNAITAAGNPYTEHPQHRSLGFLIPFSKIRVIEIL